jgi:hypothetical protein
VGDVHRHAQERQPLLLAGDDVRGALANLATHAVTDDRFNANDEFPVGLILLQRQTQEVQLDYGIVRSAVSIRYVKPDSFVGDAPPQFGPR